METTTKFGTGAVRSKDAETTRYDLISPIGLAAVAETCAEGAMKYGDFNWEKGMPIHDLLNHGLRHIYLYLSGDRSEPHLAHAAWNLLSSIHSSKLWPHLNEGTLRGTGCTPPKAAFSEWLISGIPVHAMSGDGASHPTVPTVRAAAKQEPPRPPLHACVALGGVPRDSVVLYLSGPMTGLPGYNFPAFDAAAAELRGRGWRVINPADFGAKPEKSWADHLKRDLFVLGETDVLVQLPGWENSRGGRLEFFVAKEFDKPVFGLSEVLSLP